MPLSDAQWASILLHFQAARFGTGNRKLSITSTQVFTLDVEKAYVASKQWFSPISLSSYEDPFLLGRK